MAIAPGGMPPPADTGLEDTGPRQHDHPAKCPAQGSSARKMTISFPKDQEGEGISILKLLSSNGPGLFRLFLGATVGHRQCA